MRNLAPSRALVRRSRRLLEIAFVVVAMGIFLAIVGLALYVVPLTASSGTAFEIFNAGRGVLFVGGVLMGLSGIAMAIRAVTWKVENDLARTTGDILARHLDEHFTFIRNISRRSLGYIDAILVGKPGVLVFRIVDFEGAYFNERGKWLKESRGDWRPMRTNLTQEALDDIRSLKEYLEQRDIFVPIFGVVVFINDPPFAQFELKDPVIPVAHLSQLHERLQRNYLARDRIEQGEADAIAKLILKH